MFMPLTTAVRIAKVGRLLGEQVVNRFSQIGQLHNPLCACPLA
jgi:hypothetical protein